MIKTACEFTFTGGFLALCFLKDIGHKDLQTDEK